MNTKRRFSASLLAIVAFVGLSCSEGNPVAPNGTILTISTSSNRIAANGSAVITVTGRRPDGNPIAEGTDVFFSTTLGTISPTMAEAGTNGQVTAILVGDGRIGASTVTASLDGTRGGGTTGGGDDDDDSTGASGATTVSISIQLGATPTLTVVANPDNIPTEGTSTITIIARNEDGSAVDPGQRVNLVSNLGSLNPSNPQLDGNGRATSTLRAGTQSGTARVQAFLAGVTAEGSLTIRDAAAALSLEIASDSTQTSVRRGLSANAVKLVASVLNSQGLALQGVGVQLSTPLGQLSTALGTTNSQGQVTTTLTIDGATIDLTVNAIVVTATTPGVESRTRSIPVVP